MVMPAMMVMAAAGSAAIKTPAPTTVGAARTAVASPATVEVAAVTAAIAPAATERALEARAGIAADASGVARREFLARAGVRRAGLAGQKNLVVLRDGRSCSGTGGSSQGFALVMRFAEAASRKLLGFLVSGVSFGFR